MQLATPVAQHLPPKTAWTLSLPVVRTDRGHAQQSQHVHCLLALLPGAGLFRRGKAIISRRQRMQTPKVEISMEAPESTNFREAEQFLGISSLHPWQRDIAHAALAGKDSCVYMGTGSGKSVCFQLPALVSGKVVIVVSPLIALMKEQVQKFNEKAKTQGSRMKACFLGSGHDAERRPKVDEAALRGEYNLIYITPEKLTQYGNFLVRLRHLASENRIALLAVDEAHSISEWGGEFRPCYRELCFFREDYPKVPIMSLTAIKAPRIKEDIEHYLELRLKDGMVREGTAYRPNLILKRSQPLPGFGDLERIAEEVCREGERTIIYVNQRKDAEKVGAKLKDILKSSDVSVGIYHAEIDQRDRDAAHDDFSEEGAHIMVATVPYGLGIDFPNVRRLYNLGAPTLVERYFQQIGRAGRDGKPAVCELIASDADFAKLRDPNAEEEWQKKSFESMRSLIHSSECLWNHLLKYMGEEPLSGGCGSCDVCKAKEQLYEGLKDATPQSKVFFEAVRMFQQDGKPRCFTKIANLICDNKASKVEFPEARFRKAAAHLKQTCKAMGLRVQTKIKKFYQSLVPILVTHGYLGRRSVRCGPWFKSRKYEVYFLLDKGNEVLECEREVLLQIPPSCQELQIVLS